TLSPVQGIGAAIVLGSVWAGQRTNRPPKQGAATGLEKARPQAT
ncbi:hypothetical protein SAMN05421751_1398, partial [Jhaorihella thermophila]